MKQGITINDILALADIEMKVYEQTVGSFIYDIKFQSSLDMTTEELDLVERALLEKVIVNSLDKNDIMDLIIDHASDLKYYRDNEDLMTYDPLYGSVKASNLYKVLNDLINS